MIMKMEYVKRTVEQLKFKGIPLIDELFAVDISSNFLKSYNSDYDYIVGIICDYLPIYEYNDNSPIQYKVVGGCAITGNGLLEAMD